MQRKPGGGVRIIDWWQQNRQKAVWYVLREEDVHRGIQWSFGPGKAVLPGVIVEAQLV